MHQRTDIRTTPRHSIRILLTNQRLSFPRRVRRQTSSIQDFLFIHSVGTMQLRVQAYLIVALMFVAGLPLAVFWSWPYSRILQDEKAKVYDRHLLIAENMASILELYHRDLVTALKAFREPIVAGGGLEAIALFKNLHFRHICVAEEASGSVLRSYLADTDPCPDRVPNERMALFRDLAERNTVGTSQVFHVDGNRPVLFLATRVGQKLVIGAVYTHFFEELRGQVTFGQNGHAAIVDQTGTVLAHPVAGWADRAVDFRNLPPVRRILAGENGVETFVSPAAKQEMISGFATVPGVGWGVIVPQPMSELEDAAAQFNSDALWILMLGLALSLAMALAISVQFSRRLQNIAAAVHAVAREDDDAFVSPSKDLIGVKELLELELDVNQLARDSAITRSSQSAHNKTLESTNRRLRKEMDDRRIAEAGQRHSELRFRSLFENAPIPIREEDLSGMKRLIDGLNLTDPDEFAAYVDAHPEFLEECGRAIVVVDANRASLDLHGYADKAEMLAKVVRHLSPAALRIVRMTVDVIHRKQNGRTYETKITRTDGEVRTVAATWSVVPGHEDTYSRILLSSVDLTERLKSEDALRQAQKMEAVGQLTGGVAHDFNNLLTVIGGNLELLDASAELDSELTSPILKAVRRGADLTRRLLAFSRNQPLSPQPIDLGELVLGISKLIQRTLGEEIAVEIRNQDRGWLALADPGQVEAALLNMALNSRDAMPDGGMLQISIENSVVDATSELDLEPGDYVVLQVSDTGIGMTQETSSRAFEPFFTTKQVGKGSGLGLSMVYGFAKQSGGDVLIDSKPSIGTSVSLYLPRTRGTVMERRERGTGDFPERADGEVVLVLEDEPDVRSYLLRLLDCFGYRAVPAENAEQARQILDGGQKVDLLLSDVMLPGGVRGPEFATEFVDRFPNVPVIFVSGRPSDAELPSHESLAGAPLLAKPFDQDELAETIRSALKGDLGQLGRARTD